MDTIEILSDKATSIGYRFWVSKKHNQLKSGLLSNEKTLCAFSEAVEEANYLDCIWFENDKNIPAIFKICENRNFIEGLYRLKTMKELIPPYPTTYYLIANDNLESEIILELTKPVFKNFNVKIIQTSKIEGFNFLHSS